MKPKMTISELNGFLKEEFPQLKDDFVIEALTETGCIVRLKADERHLRPGNTISGPAMFALADVAMYIAVISRIGAVGLAVTTNCSIDFMRKPVAGVDLIGEATIHKLGRVLAVGDVTLRSAQTDPLVARASLTYSIPPKS